MKKILLLSIYIITAYFRSYAGTNAVCQMGDENCTPAWGACVIKFPQSKIKIKNGEEEVELLMKDGKLVLKMSATIPLKYGQKAPKFFQIHNNILVPQKIAESLGFKSSLMIQSGRHSLVPSWPCNPTENPCPCIGIFLNYKVN